MLKFAIFILSFFTKYLKSPFAQLSIHFLWNFLLSLINFDFFLPILWEQFQKEILCDFTHWLQALEPLLGCYTAHIVLEIDVRAFLFLGEDQFLNRRWTNWIENMYWIRFWHWKCRWYERPRIWIKTVGIVWFWRKLIVIRVVVHRWKFFIYIIING